MATHDACRDRLLDLAYGELGRREERALRAHLEACPECRAELARLTATRRAMAGLGDEPAPERGLETLLAAAREAVRDRRPRPFLPAWLWGASMGAVAAAAVAILAVKLSAPARLGAPAGEVDLVAHAPAPAAPEPPAASAKLEAPLAGKGLVGSAEAGGSAGTGGPAASAASKPAPGPAPAPAASYKSAPARRDRAAALAESSSAAEAREAQGGSAATAPSVKAPPPAFASAPAPAQAERMEAEAARDRVASDPASAIREEKAAPGRRPAWTATFRDCPGETAREVDVDGQGRVVRYVRRGVLHGIAFVAELRYGEDGQLAEVRYRAGGGERTWRPGAGDAGVPAAVREPRRAAEAGLDAPPRCGE